MSEKKRQNPGPTEAPGTDARSPAPGGATASQPDGLSGGVTDTDARDGEADDSDSGYSDEDLMRTGGGGRKD